MALGCIHTVCMDGLLQGGADTVAVAASMIADIIMGPFFNVARVSETSNTPLRILSIIDGPRRRGLMCMCVCVCVESVNAGMLL